LDIGYSSTKEGRATVVFSAEALEDKDSHGNVNSIVQFLYSFLYSKVEVILQFHVRSENPNSCMPY
jgi:hypothetical protein